METKHNHCVYTDTDVVRKPTDQITDRPMRLFIVTTLFTTCLSVMGQGIDTEYKYVDSTSKGVIIQNSLPRGGLLYTDPAGKESGYVIFYHRIMNETASPLELTIHFPSDSIPLPSSPSTYFHFFLPPPDTMALETKISYNHFSDEELFNYGLDIKSYVDNSRNKPALLQRTIYPKDSCLFYVLVISTYRVENEGRPGFSARAGFSLEGQDLFYRINTIEFTCGQLVWKD